MVRTRELENKILASVIREYIATAQPVSSRVIVEKYIPNISTASVRNILFNLEKKGVLTHPFTSSGRVPTNMGYKYYVDTLMNSRGPDHEIRNMIDETMEKMPSELEILLNLTSRLIGTLTDEVGVAMAPVLMKGIVDDVQLLELSGDRLLLVFQIENGLVKTVMVETRQLLNKASIAFIQNLFKELFVGYNLYSMKRKLDQILVDIPGRERGLVELICGQIEQQMMPRIHTSGNYSFLVKPEYREPANSDVLHLLMTEGWMFKLRDKIPENLNTESFTMLTGDDIDFVSGSDCSVIMSGVILGNLEGALAVVGPSRMDYDFVIPLLRFLSEKVNRKINKIKESE
jgi:heat-inducible transcriptional repressor